MNEVMYKELATVFERTKRELESPLVLTGMCAEDVDDYEMNIVYFVSAPDDTEDVVTEMHNMEWRMQRSSFNNIFVMPTPRPNALDD